MKTLEQRADEYAAWMQKVGLNNGTIPLPDAKDRAEGGAKLEEMRRWFASCLMRFWELTAEKYK